MPPSILEGVRVAHVISVNGWLFLQRRGAGPWKVARPGMDVCVGDRLETSEYSRAALEFNIGGKIGINQGVMIEVTGRRDVVQIASGWQRIKNQVYGVYARYAKQSEQVRIQTENTGGVRG